MAAAAIAFTFTFTFAFTLITLLSMPARAAQGGPGPPPPSTVSAAPTSPALAKDAGQVEERVPLPPRGPALRERGGRRARGASAASGALFVVVLVGAMGYYVVKRLRR